MPDIPTVHLAKEPFAKAVEECLLVALQARDGDGVLAQRLVNAFTMAKEVRAAIGRACGARVEVQGWRELTASRAPVPVDPKAARAIRT